MVAGTAVAATAGVLAAVITGGGKVAVGWTAVSGEDGVETAVSVVGAQAIISNKRASHKNRLMPFSIPMPNVTVLTQLLTVPITTYACDAEKSCDNGGTSGGQRPDSFRRAISSRTK